MIILHLTTTVDRQKISFKMNFNIVQIRRVNSIIKPDSYWRGLGTVKMEEGRASIVLGFKNQLENLYLSNKSIK